MADATPDLTVATEKAKAILKLLGMPKTAQDYLNQLGALSACLAKVIAVASLDDDAGLRMIESVHMDVIDNYRANRVVISGSQTLGSTQ